MEVSARTYAYYERGERNPDAEALVPLCVEGWNVNWILTGDGPERFDYEKNDNSQLCMPDYNNLAETIEIVEAGLDALNHEISAKDKARLISLVIQHINEQSGSLTPSQMVAFVLKSIKEVINAE